MDKELQKLFDDVRERSAGFNIPKMKKRNPPEWSRIRRLRLARHWQFPCPALSPQAANPSVFASTSFDRFLLGRGPSPGGVEWPSGGCGLLLRWVWKPGACRNQVAEDQRFPLRPDEVIVPCLPERRRG